MKTVKLIASDMDNTLLTTNGDLPPKFDEYIDRLANVGIDFAIASGRPLYTLQNIFKNRMDKMTFISDNGGAIIHNGETIFTSLIEKQRYDTLTKFVEDQTDGIVIICGLNSAYANSKYKKYDDIFRYFYANLTYVDDLLTVDADVNKFTIYFPENDAKENYEEIFIPTFGEKYSVTVGDTMWIDLMNIGVDKGEAMRRLGEKLDISVDEMMAFGDTFNDIEMLEAVKFSYLVDNAHDDMKAYANFRTASNDDFGVTQVLDELLNKVE